MSRPRVTIRSRDTFRPLYVLSDDEVLTLRYDIRWRVTAGASLSLNPLTLRDGVYQALFDGAYVDVHRTLESGESERYFGIVTGLSIAAPQGARGYGGMTTVNEIIVLGADPDRAKRFNVSDPASRAVYRFYNAESQRLHGVIEGIIDDAGIENEEQAREEAEITLANAERDSFASYKARWDQRFQATALNVSMVDPWTLIDRRIIDTTGELTRNPDNTSAGDYISSLLETEIINPTLGRRRDPLLEFEIAQTGRAVTLPIRWQNLGRAVRYAMYLGQLGHTYRVNDERGKIVLSVREPRDRTQGANRVVLGANVEVEDLHLRAGDLCIGLFDADMRPDPAELKLLVTGKRVELQRSGAVREWPTIERALDRKPASV